MSQTLTLELSEPVFTAIQQRAARLGMPPEHLVAELLQQTFIQTVPLPSAKADQEVARSNFERHFGMLESDALVDIDNESIDADLTAEYAALHEED